MLTDDVPQVSHLALEQAALCRLEFQPMVVEALEHFLQVAQVTTEIRREHNHIIQIYQQGVIY